MKLSAIQREKKERAALLYESIAAILNNPEASGEEKESVQPMFEEAEELTADLFQLDQVTKAYDKLAKMDTTEGRAPEGSEFGSLGEFLEAVNIAQEAKAYDPRLTWMESESPVQAKRGQKDSIGAVGAQGGFLIPPEFQTSFYSVSAEPSLFMQRATRLPMRRRNLLIPVLDQTETTPDQPHWFGGIQAFWQAEATEKGISDAEWREVELTAHEIVGFTRVSDALLDDAAVSLEAFFNGELGFRGAMTWMIENAMVRGTGAGKPRGFLGAGVTLSAPRAAAGSIDYVDILQMYQRFLTTGGQGIWMVSQSALAELAQISGPTGNPLFVWMNNAQNSIPAMLLGLPVYFTEKMDTLGTPGDIALVNPPFYLVGDRQATTIESTKFEQWRFNKTSWRAVARVDGQPWLSAPLTLRDGSTQISPFVILDGGST